MKIIIILLPGVLEPWCLFQCKNCKQQFISSRISDQNSTLNSNKLHTDNNWNNWTALNFNLFHFQRNRMWMVNMTSKTKSWLVNSPISLDIVRWLVIILSPVFGTKVLTEDTIFTPLTGDRTTILCDHLSHMTVWPFAGQRVQCHFTIIFRLWVLTQPQGPNPWHLDLQSSPLWTELASPATELMPSNIGTCTRRTVEYFLRVSASRRFLRILNFHSIVPNINSLNNSYKQ